MSKLLYVLKLHIFRDQFKMTTHEAPSCLEFGLCVTLIYCKAWTTCISPCDAPLNDINLIQLLTNYRTTSDVISAAGHRSMGRHLWYLGQELTPLALFSEQVSPEVKQQMMLQLNQFEPQAEIRERSVRYSSSDDITNRL